MCVLLQISAPEVNEDSLTECAVPYPFIAAELSDHEKSSILYDFVALTFYTILMYLLYQCLDFLHEFCC